MNVSGEAVGKVTDYFWKRDTVRIKVLNGSIREGEKLHVTGEHTEVTITAEGMEVDGEPIEEAKQGTVFSMPLEPKNRVVLGDKVYRMDDVE